MKTARSTAIFLAGLLWAAAAVVQAQQTDIPNRADPIEGITTGGQPSAQALSAIAEQGYTAVIDLRSAGEDRGFDEAATVEGLGMSYISLPVSGASGISYENANALDRILADIDGPVLLHCASSNRVGALLALRARMHGADAANALALGVDAGLTSLQPVVEEALSASPDQ